MIVGSILLAFGLQAWWDGVQEREEEQAALRGLETDFTANLGRIRGAILQRADDHSRMGRCHFADHLPAHGRLTVVDGAPF